MKKKIFLLSFIIVIIVICILLKNRDYIYLNYNVSKNHNFIEKNSNELFELDNNSYIIYLDAKEEKISQKLVTKLDKLSRKYDINVYYNLDKYEKLEKKLKKIDKKINKSNYKPMIIFVKNGKVIEYFYGNLLTNEIIENELDKDFKKLLPDICENKNSC